jgi:WD40 repeat protein
VFEAASGKEVSRLTRQGRVRAVAFSPDGRWVATGSYDNTARVFEAASGKEVSRLTQQGPVSAVAFSPDGRWVATGSYDKTARVFEAASGKEVAKVPLRDTVSFVSFGPDGRSRLNAIPATLLAVTPNAAHLIDLSTHQETSRIDAGGAVRAARLTEGQRYLELATVLASTAERDVVTEVRITRHALRPDDLQEDACSRLTRNLTLEEWKEYLGPAIPYRRTCPKLPWPPDYSGKK